MHYTAIPIFNIRTVFFVISFIIFSACNKGSDNLDNGSPSPNPPNILLIIADDLGKDAINGFSEGNIKPVAPNIDKIRTDGLSFSKFWVYPTCSPTRASILTGKYGYRTGVKWASDVLNESETSLQEYINNQTLDRYSTAIVGKWHLSGGNSTFNPEVFGIDYYAGLIRGDAGDYFNWQLTEDGVATTETTYITTKFTNLAIDWIQQQSKPWFMWLAYNAPHTPFHVPPSEMHGQGDLPEYTSGMDATPYYMAAIEAMDFQIGRLLDSMTDSERENTVIIFMGDNGTPNQVAQQPYSNATAKGTLYQGGINTPLFISGKGVTRTGIDENLITSSDLFATIASISGVPVTEIHDSRNFRTLFTEETVLRGYQYSEKDNGNDDLWTISNGDYKLIENANGSAEFYNLNNDPYEQNNLLNGALNGSEFTTKSILENELTKIRQ